MNIKFTFVTLIAFFIISIIISAFVEPRNVKFEKKFKEQNNINRDMMGYIYNKNSGDDIQTYIDAFNSVDGFKPNYKGWGDSNV